MPNGNDKSNMPEIVRRGANLPDDRWTIERVTAAIRLLPQEFQDPANAIGFLSMASAYGLDPFAKEIWAWEHRGKLQIMVSRDGWTKILRMDDSVLGVQVDHVRQGDEFRVSRDPNGKVVVTHESAPFDAGDVVGAYCVIRMRGGPDVFQVRKIEDYQHLRRKENWQTAEHEMLLTRVLSFAGRLATGATIYTEADFQLRENAAERRIQDLIDRRESEMIEFDSKPHGPYDPPTFDVEELSDEEEWAEIPFGPYDPPTFDVEELSDEEEWAEAEPVEAEPQKTEDASVEDVTVPDRYYLPNGYSVVLDRRSNTYSVLERGVSVAVGPDMEDLLDDLLPHECSICGMRFATSQAVGGHSRSHTPAERGVVDEEAPEEVPRGSDSPSE